MADGSAILRQVQSIFPDLRSLRKLPSENGITPLNFYHEETCQAGFKISAATEKFPVKLSAMALRVPTNTTPPDA
jgi:hypothetical protein